MEGGSSVSHPLGMHAKTARLRAPAPDVSHTLLRAYQLEIAACRAQKRAHNLQRIRSLAAEVAALGLRCGNHPPRVDLRAIPTSWPRLDATLLFVNPKA